MSKDLGFSSVLQTACCATVVERVIPDSCAYVVPSWLLHHVGFSAHGYMLLAVSTTQRSPKVRKSSNPRQVLGITRDK